MNLAVKICIFVFCLNIGVAILNATLTPLGFLDYISYTNNMTNAAITNMEGDISLSGQLASTPTMMDRILNWVSLGVYQKVQSFVNKYIFGLSYILELMFSGVGLGDYYAVLKPFVWMFLTFTYIWFIFYMFSGRRLAASWQ